MIKFVLLSTLVALASASVPRLDGRIVGGVPTTIDKYPYQLSLQYYGSHICGASIISEKWAVTAAHCTDGSHPSFLSVRAGSTQHGSGGEVSQVLRIHQNPSFNGNTIDYDISILELATELKMGDGVQPVVLPKLDEQIPVGSPVVCTGWGTLAEGGSIPDELQTVTVNVVSEDDCKAAYGSSSITPRMLCAGVSGGGKDACQGDSGGPLAANGKLVGIVSWGYGCARPRYPGVYSHVGNLRDYITNITGM